MARLHGATAEDYARAFAVVGGLKPQVLPPGVGVNRNGIKEGIAWGVFSGIAAEQLSRAGLTGPRECLDNDLLNAERIAAGQPDGRFEIELTEFKPYVCCAWTHTPAEALLGLIDDNGLSAEEIDRVQVATHTNAVHMIDNTPDPPTLQAAQYNIPWVLAVAAVDGVNGLLPLRESTVGRPELIQFANRVELAVDAKYDIPAQPRGARVTIDTGRGTFVRDLPQDHEPGRPGVGRAQVPHHHPGPAVGRAPGPDRRRRDGARRRHRAADRADPAGTGPRGLTMSDDTLDVTVGADNRGPIGREMWPEETGQRSAAWQLASRLLHPPAELIARLIAPIGRWAVAPTSARCGASSRRCRRSCGR